MRLVYLYAFLIALVTFLNCCGAKTGIENSDKIQTSTVDLGKAIVTESIPLYELADGHNAFDAFNFNISGSPISIAKNPQFVTIKNVMSSGFSGETIQFEIGKDLTIQNASYSSFIDIIDGSEEKYLVEKAILALDANPFSDSLTSGYYTLQIKRFYKPGTSYSKDKPDTTQFFYNGKFKIYTQEEISKGKDWLIDGYETRFRLVEPNGIHSFPETDAKFLPGKQKLYDLLSRHRPDTLKDEFSVFFIIEKDGSIEPHTIQLDSENRNPEFLKQIRSDKALWSNWAPAEFMGRKVKSRAIITLPKKKR